MKKELEESLRYIQSHPTTGTPHNQQLISTQVETIFMIDELMSELKKLNKTIENATEQDQLLEKSNYRLQIAMLIFTAVGTTILTFQFLEKIIPSIIKNLLPLLSLFKDITFPSQEFISVLAAIVATIMGILTFLLEVKVVRKLKYKQEKAKGILSSLIKELET